MLKTNRLILRAACPADIDDMFAIYSDARAMQFWSTAPHTTKAQTREKLDRIIAQPADKLRYFMIELDGRVIGTAGMHSKDEVGFILHPDFWRMGLVTEAMSAIIPHLFATTDLTQLTADADPNNVASVKCLQSLGFVETGTAKNTFCINGVWSDSVYFALPRPD